MKIWIHPAVMPLEGVNYELDKVSCKYRFYDEVTSILKDPQDGKIRLLMSAGLWSDKRMLSYTFDRRGLDFAILADSAGFQYYGFDDLKRREFYEKRELYYKWQVKEGDLVLAGDVPPKKSVLDREKIKQLIDITQRNIEFQFSLDKDLSSRFVNIIHGIGLNDMKTWYKVMSQYKGRGWAIGAKFNNALLGAALQYFFLLENGGFKEGDVVHFFALTGMTVFIPLVWLVKKTRPDLTVSVDSSSFSLNRFGKWYNVDGTKPDYIDVREGRTTLKLYDGTELTDIPRNMDTASYKKIEITCLQNFVKHMRFVGQDVIDNEEKYADILNESKIKRYYKEWRTGGEEMLWELHRDNIVETGEVLE